MSQEAKKMKLETLLKPSKLIDKAKLGMKGAAGFAAATVALEAGTQLLERFVFDRYLPQAANLMNTVITTSAPALGTIDVRDAIVLLPAEQQTYKALSSGNKQAHIINALASYGTKVILRRTGLNPKEIADKTEKIIAQPMRLPSVM